MVHCLIIVKFATGIKNVIWFNHYTDVCKALYTRYFPESCEESQQANYSGGFRTHDFCHSTADVLPLDHQDSLVATGSSNH